MTTVSKKGESLEGKVTITLTQRDILLLNLCLKLVDLNYSNTGSLRLDIQSLQHKLSHESEESR